MEPEIRYARSGDISVAYEVAGDGPIDLVQVSGFISHLELVREFPHMAEHHAALARIARVVRFDKRGTGLSDRSLGFGSAAERMDDIRAVMDDVGLERASLYGISEGGPLSILFAATYPDRVDKLVLFGSYARLLPAADYDAPGSIDPERYARFVERQWGTGEVFEPFIGPQIEPDRLRAFSARYERNCASPHIAADIMRSNLSMDVREALSSVTAPTLVMHNSGDPIVPVWHGRYLADAIAGARLVEFDSPLHVDFQNFVANETLASFLTGGTVASAPAERVLATVLFTDIVDSTAQAVAVGDAAWRKTIDGFEDAARRQIDMVGGRLVKTTGDGFLATFDGPARALRCAEALHAEAATLGLTLRAGLHTGEVERRGEDIAGIGVHLAARVMGAATDGEILVSRTVRDLVAGSGIELADRGSHQLKGIDEPWQLYAMAGASP